MSGIEMKTTSKQVKIKTALYQYIIGDLVFSVVFIVCSLLVLIRYIFVSCLFLVSDYYS